MKVGGGNRDGGFGLVHIAEQEFSETVSAGAARTLRGVRLERELSARELIAYLIVVLARELKPKGE